MLPIKFKVKKPFDSGEEVKNRFSRWPPWQRPWISDQKDFSYFLPISQPDASYKFRVNWLFQFRRSEKQIFKVAAKAAILDFRSGRF